MARERLNDDAWVQHELTLHIVKEKDPDLWEMLVYVYREIARVKRQGGPVTLSVSRANRMAKRLREFKV